MHKIISPTRIMKKIKFLLPLVATLNCSSLLIAQQKDVRINPDRETFHFPIKIVEDKETPQFYSSEVKNNVFIRKDTYSQSANIKIKALQGKSERFSLKLSRRVKSAKVTSTKLKDWAFREDTETKQQFIDIFPKGDNIKEMEIAFYFNEEIDKTNLTVYEVLTFAPVTKESGGFSETVIVSNESNAMIRPISQNGYQPVESSIDNVDKYLTHTGGSLKLSTNHTQFFSGQNYVDQLEVDAVVSEDGKSADLRVRGVYISYASKGGRDLKQRVRLVMVNIVFH